LNVEDDEDVQLFFDVYSWWTEFGSNRMTMFILGGQNLVPRG